MKFFKAYCLVWFAWSVALATLNGVQGDTLWTVVDAACALVYAVLLYCNKN